jgi:pyruvate kinase
MYRHNFNKTKIVATIGPATSSYKKLKKIIRAGVDVCRLNFSHGTHEDHVEVIKNIRLINEELNSNVCILQDLQGPKLRIGEIEENVVLKSDDVITVTTEPCVGTREKFSVSYINLTRDLKKGEKILIDDGKIVLEVLRKLNETDLSAKVIYGGPISSNKGFNLPESKLSVPSITEKDLADLQFGLENDVEWIALSFVRKPEDIIFLKGIIERRMKSSKVIAKIEKPQAVKNIEKIIEVSDGIMVARGDLGVELPVEEVPLIQKDIVKKCNEMSKPVIIATQMMESMIESSMPTRAEVNDAANAVLDGADAVMLSGETSVGKYPVKVIEYMEKIIRDVEKDERVYYKGKKPDESSKTFLSDEICFTAVRMSDHIGAKAIIGMTKSGYTGYKVASFRPKADIYIFTDHLPLLNTMNLVWGVRGFFYDKFSSTDETFNDVMSILQQNKVIKKNDRIIHTASMPIHEKQRTNMIKIGQVK